MMLKCRKKKIGKNCSIAKDVKIICKSLKLGDEVTIESGTDIYLHGILEVQDLSILGPSTRIRGNNVSIGSEFYSDGDLEIGGGGWTNPQANLKVGDRCVMHNNHLNINRPITIGNHVGLSPRVDLITHGYWNSILKGFPFREGPIIIEDNVIVGWASIILGNVRIGEYAVIAAGSIVTNDVESYYVVGGVPAKPIYKIKPDSLSGGEKLSITKEIIREYKESLKFRNIKDVKIKLVYPKVYVNDAVFDLEEEKYDVEKHTNVTDDFRDFIRRKGIWFYGRHFKSIKKKVI